MRIKRLLTFAGVLLIFSAVIYTVIIAQKTTGGISVHPSNFDITSVPNQKYSGNVTVDNLTDKPFQVRVDLRNFTAQGEEGSVNLTQEDSTYALAKWIKVEPTTVDIKAHSSQKFTFTIDPPQNAEPGGHFGSIVFATVPPKNTSGAGAALSQEVASLILFKIPGNIKEQATLESFSTENSFYEFGPVLFNARVRNEGGAHVAPVGSIIIKGWFGQKFIIPLDSRNVLPNAVRKIPATLKNKLLVGNYNATLIATYGIKGKQLNASTDFNAFPVRYGAIILVVLIILFLIRKRLGRSIKIILTGN